LLFIFFIVYSSFKFMFYFSPYWNWKKAQEKKPKNKKEIKLRRAKEKRLKKQARKEKF